MPTASIELSRVLPASPDRAAPARARTPDRARR